MQYLKISFIVLTLITSQNVIAAYSKHAIGSSIGSSETSQELYEKATSLSVYYQYKTNQYFAVESGLIFLGDFDEKNSFGIYSQALSGFYGSLTGILPVSGRVNLFAKYGIISWEVESRTNFIYDYTTNTETGTSAVYGVGVKVIDLLTIRTEYQKFENIGNHNVMNLAIGVIFNFR